jgi:F-type H+-transporting ATPase subunit gamma
MASQKDTKSRIASVKNIQKITRAMEMVSAARLRRAEQRIEQLRPYAEGIRKMTRRASEAAESIPNLPVLQEREQINTIGLLLVTSDRGLAGAFNSQIIRAGITRSREIEADGKTVKWYSSGRRGVSSLQFRGFELEGAYTGFTDRPAYADARGMAGEVTAAYVDGEIDRLEIIYNHYVSPLTQTVSHETLLPLQQADILGEEEEEEEQQSEGSPHRRALWIYEPEPEEILARLVPVYLETEIYRALLESAASEQGARMTAMRNASKNAGELIEQYTLEMNRQRQAEITQEIMEVVAGAEGLR